MTTRTLDRRLEKLEVAADMGNPYRHLSDDQLDRVIETLSQELAEGSPPTEPIHHRDDRYRFRHLSDDQLDRLIETLMAA